MKIIEPSAEIVETTGILSKDIEIAARNCYLSYDRMRDGSDMIMVRRLLQSGHYAMLEFGPQICFMAADNNVEYELSEVLFVLGLNRFFRMGFDENIDCRLFSCDPRTAFEICRIDIKDLQQSYPIIIHLQRFMAEQLRDIIDIAGIDLDELLKHKYDGLFIKQTPMTPSEIRAHCCVTAKIVTTRTVLAQLTRHRQASYAVTSMRYINWSKARFGSELTFVRPLWAAENEKCSWIWEEGCSRSERDYFDLIARGLRPEQARSVVLPDIRTDILVKASIGQWIDSIIKDRCSDAADPEMRRVMMPLRDSFSKKYPEFFLNLSKRQRNEKEITK